MKISVILGHPNKGSFNHAIARAAMEVLIANNHEAMLHDLYDERFDPVLNQDEIPQNAPLSPMIKSHCEEIAIADGIIIVHPNWWGQPPAILKGWVDRVLRPGVAYEFGEGDSGEGIPKGLLKARAALVFNTSNTPESREKNTFGDPLEYIWRDCIFGFCGVPAFERRMFQTLVTSSPDQRAQWLDEVKDVVGRHFA